MSQISSALREIWEGFDFSYILSLLLGIIPALVCITLHELAHGYAAWRLGDYTAKVRGRLTLNPLKHLDAMGLLMMLVFRVGWAKPVPVNIFNFKDPKRGMALTALAGPVCNILLAAFFMLLYGLFYIPFGSGAVGQYVLIMLLLSAELSVGMAVFNLIPFPPLDGSKLLFAFLKDESYYKLMRYERYAALSLFALMYLGVLDAPLSAAREWVLELFEPLAQFACDAVYYLFYQSK